MMNNQNKNTAELLKELEDLRQENSALKAFYENIIAKSNQNEIKLQISEAQKNAILNGIKSNIAFVDKDLKIIWANKTAADSVHKKPSEMIGHTCHHFWADDAKACENCPSLRAFETHKSEQTIMQTPDGTIWDERGEPIFDNSGNLIGVVEIATDITNSEKAKQLLFESNKRYDELTRRIPVGIYTLKTAANGEMNFEYVSERFCQMFEVGVNELPFDTEYLHRSIHPDDRASIDEANRQAALTRLPFRWEGRSLIKGEVRWLRIESEPTVLPGGDSIWNGVVIDVTQQKQAEMLLRESEETYRSILHASPDDITITDLEGRILMVSPAAKKIIGCDDDSQILGRFLSEFIVPEDRERANKNIALMFQGTMTGFGLYRGLRPDGSTFEMEANAEFIRDASGKPVKMVFVVRDISERKKVENALLESEQKYRNLFKKSQTAMFRTLIDGSRVLDVNEKLLQTFGYTYEEMVEKPSIILYHDPVQRNELIKLIQQNGSVSNFEVELIKKDGSLITTLMSVNSYPKEGILEGSFVDITERKKAEERIFRNEKELKKAQEITHIGSWYLDFETNEVTWTEELYKMYGFDPTNPPPPYSEHQKLFTPESWDLLASSLVNTQETGAPYELELRTVRRDGTNGWMWVRGETLLDNEGKTIGLWGAAQDITERKKNEDTLSKTNAYLENLINYANAPIIVWNPQFNITRFNHAFEYLTGYSEAEVLGKSLEILFPPELVEKSMSLIHKTLTGERWESVEIQIQHRNNSVRTLLWNSATLFSADGLTPIATIAQGQDITQRKQAEDALKISEAELRELNATKDKFFSIIAHDLKSPFNSIMGFSELLVDQIKEKDYEGIEKYADIILKSSSRAVDLLMNLLEWTRSQTGRMEFNPEYFEMVKFVHEMLPMFQDIAGQKSIAIIKQLPANAPVFADTAMISTVLRNLLSNAIKFTRTGGKITISVANEKQQVTVSVSDTGIGIPKNRMQNLFKIDESYSTPGTNNEKGTGLGLILCKEFIEKHHGKFHVESVEGQGSTFAFSIPLY